ncbi:MAG: response regulator [Piscinibacter sp.]
MKKILIVDDHVDIRRLIRLTLEVEDCEVREAADAAAGWQEALRFKPDLVLLDVMMPGDGNGLDLCLAIKLEPSLARTRVIMLSARGSSTDRDAGLRSGADAYLVKPFSPMQLLGMLQGEEATA